MNRNLSWVNPQTYADATPIPANKISSIKIHVYKDGAETYVTLPGVTTWPIDVGDPGTTSVWELTAELDGQTSAKSPSYTYVEPFLQPMSPTAVGIS